jgi:hypothetical protein
MEADGLTAIRDKTGQITFICSKCRGAAEPAPGSQDKDQLPYLMVCTKCGAILGEWAFKDERAAAIDALAVKVFEATT